MVDKILRTIISQMHDKIIFYAAPLASNPAHVVDFALGITDFHLNIHHHERPKLVAKDLMQAVNTNENKTGLLLIALASATWKIAALLWVLIKCSASPDDS